MFPLLPISADEQQKIGAREGEEGTEEPLVETSQEDGLSLDDDKLRCYLVADCNLVCSQYLKHTNIQLIRTNCAYELFLYK